MGIGKHPGVDPGEESLVILQSLICLLREKNLLSRADVERLCHQVSLRAAGAADQPLSCRQEAAVAASQDMERLGSYIGQRYGGKHARQL